ncbi:MAG TPA: DUF3800 domain-containing protein [Phycisphaerales bacterium]|nr:DUF3800 domain-containing protein [Phycisphaerales bacterium]
MTQLQMPYYVIYCDESCHDLNAHHDFMVIGAIKLLHAKKSELTYRWRQLLESLGIHAEAKWRKVSRKHLAHYQRMVDFFFDSEDLQFRAIVVDQKRLDMERFHEQDTELAFYKFYYEMLEKWLEQGNEYLILLDHKSNRDAHRFTKLRACLEAHLHGTARIRDLTVVYSVQTPLMQLCDVLTGAVAAAYNGPRPGSPKATLADHIARRMGWSTLKIATALAESKFNVFRIELE